MKILVVGAALAALLAAELEAQSILRVTTQTVAAEDADVVADNLTGAGPFSPAYSTSDSLAHQLIITTTTNEGAITATLTGTDADGRTQVEALTMPNNTTAETVKYWRTLTTIALSATVGADTFDVGIVDEVTSASLALNRESGVGAKFFLDITGTVNIDVQFTIADPAIFADQNANLWVEPYSTLVAETADSTAVVAADAGYGWYRIQWNSYSSGASARLYASQPGP
jgi:hypothetical protein